MKEDLIQVFVTDNRWQLLLSGLRATILITIVAAILGIILGVVTGIVRSAWDKNRERMERNRTAGDWILPHRCYLHHHYSWYTYCRTAHAVLLRNLRLCT